MKNTKMLAMSGNPIFSDERISLGKGAHLVVVENTRGLKIKQQTPDINAIKRLLDVRYNNSIDDIEHDNVFNGKI